MPTQDMVLGSYYLTYEKYPEHSAEETYEDVAAVKAALKKGTIGEDSLIWVHPHYGPPLCRRERGEVPQVDPYHCGPSDF